ncbi:unnamed protein product [Mytilus coruscus]|uniref:Apple domain-containing protein n=1 Tax=Mytilus coruscus TaxID=42192 RepID=A0A6J8EW18_MYTCO|nr:unnamed protein product [Mytilus coruscus]
MVDFSIVFLCVMFSIGFTQLNVVKRNFVTIKNRIILPTSTTVIQQITPSPAVCSSLCSMQETCWCASYDRKTKQCNLDESCSSESELSADALMLRKSIDQLSCRNGWFRNENKCYYFSDDQKTWKDAKIACEDDGGMLVEVESKGANDYLKMKASYPDVLN